MAYLPIPGFPNYEINCVGIVRRIEDGRIKAVHRSYQGYLAVNLYCLGKVKRFFVHRLVAVLFVGKQPTKKHQVAHLDNSRRNNHYRNLQWLLPHENEAHKLIFGTIKRGSKVGNAKLTEGKVRTIKKMLKKGYTQKIISQRYGVDESTISLIKREIYWRHVA